MQVIRHYRVSEHIGMLGVALVLDGFHQGRCAYGRREQGLPAACDRCCVVGSVRKDKAFNGHVAGCSRDLSSPG